MRGAASNAEVRAARGEVYALREVLRESGAMPSHQTVAWDLSAYVGGGSGVRRLHYVERVLYGARCCLTWTGEAADVAEACIWAVYGRALRDDVRQHGGLTEQGPAGASGAVRS